MGKIFVLWKNGPVAGVVKARNGAVGSMSGMTEEDLIAGTSFQLASSAECRLTVEVDNARVQPGADPTAITIASERNPFTFLLRDVNADNPIYIPEYTVIVTEGTDDRTYRQIEGEITQRNLRSDLERIEAEPEETYETAAAATRKQQCPTWLGLSRDIRIFEFGYEGRDGFWGYIKPRWHGDIAAIAEAEGAEAIYKFAVGRGAGCAPSIQRRLVEGCLPIVESHIADGDVHYQMTAFATLEKSALIPGNVRGTDFIVADGHGCGHMFTKEQQATYDAIHTEEENREEETVLCLSITAVNKAQVPRYAWIKSIYPAWGREIEHCGRTGITRFSGSGRAICAGRMNNKPLPGTDIAILLPPGERAVFELFIPHRPIETDRAEELGATDFRVRMEECREYWRGKLQLGARVELPEQEIQEMVNAGIQHLDLITYGKEPDEPLAATIGVYSPIGSESAPIIQFFDSMGRHSIAQRSLQYFIDKQHEDGFMQNFGEYMLETGAALWSMGEHYRYTGDDEWVRTIKPGVVKACEYMLAWRERNMKEELREKGYGMLDGKVADPEDPFHSYMLNGYAYLGMARTGEMLKREYPAEAERWAGEAELFRNDIRETFFTSMAHSPVIPTGNGSWVPTSPPWPESLAPIAMLTGEEACWTHGTYGTRDSLLGPLYLVFQEVISPHEDAAVFLLKSNAELFCARNVAFSQPYYCRNAWVHLKRGEVKAFLKTYYNGLCGLADRETYTWWEHYFHASPHKTHEEGWFLMQTRWMLWYEAGTTLHVLSGIPRKWMESGKKIELTNVATYFGPMSLTIHSEIAGKGIITATIECTGNRQPEEVIIRIPHPEGEKAVRVEGGEYDSTEETVRVRGFRGRVEVAVGYGG